MKNKTEYKNRNKSTPIVPYIIQQQITIVRATGIIHPTMKINSIEGLRERTEYVPQL